MRYIIFILFFKFCISTIGLSQPPADEKVSLDSLKNVINEAGHDSTIINAWISWHDLVNKANPDLGLEINKKIDSLSSRNLKKGLSEKEALFFKKSMGLSYKNKANYHKKQNDFSQAIDDYIKSIQFYSEIGEEKLVADILNTIAVSYYYQSKNEKALDYYNQSLKLYHKINYKKGIASSLSGIGIIYHIQGDYANAIDFYTKSLKIQEEIGDKKGMAQTMNNIGVIYVELDDDKKTIKYFKQSLVLRKELGDKEGVGASSLNIGNIFLNKGDYEKALEYYNTSLEINNEIDYQKGIADVSSNIGLIFYQKGVEEREKCNCKNDGGNLFKAKDYFINALNIYENIGDQVGNAASLVNLSNLYLQNKNNAESIKYAEKALKIAQEIGVVIQIRDAAEALWQNYKSTSQHRKALESYELYISIRDSIKSDENNKEVIRQEIKFNYEKQAALDSVEYAKEKKLANATIAKQIAESEKKDAELVAKRNQQYALFGGVGLLLIFGGFMFNRFRITRKQKIIIEEKERQTQLQNVEISQQKEIVEEKNTEILDSITYAKRLQDAILPSREDLNLHLNDGFVLFKPKDIVSGDFYWMETTKTHTFLAAADCTGHGVPGAMVSVVCANALNKSINELGKTDPAEILNATRELVIATFAKAGSDVKDGMDISLLAINKPSEGLLKVSYAGANNPLWIIRKDATEVEEIKADKQPIGLYGDLKPFTSHEVKLNKGDVIYMFSDGYVDQFGGEKGKKLKSGTFKKILLEHKGEEMYKQEGILDRTFEEWKGGLEQVDDVCVIGVKIYQ